MLCTLRRQQAPVKAGNQAAHAANGCQTGRPMPPQCYNLSGGGWGHSLQQQRLVLVGCRIAAVSLGAAGGGHRVHGSHNCLGLLIGGGGRAQQHPQRAGRWQSGRHATAAAGGGCRPGRWGCCRAGGRRLRGLRTCNRSVSRPAAREAARARRGRLGRRARRLERTAAGFQPIHSQWRCDQGRGVQASGHAAAMSASHRGAPSACAAAHWWRH